MLKFYLYRSRIAVGQYDIEDLEILRCGLRNNTAYGVTGFVYKSRTHFFQYFEGTPPIADQLFQNIINDKRHLDVHVLMSGEAPYRRFAGWSMGYGDYLDTDPRNHIDPSEAPSSVLQKLETRYERQSAKFTNKAMHAR